MPQKRRWLEEEEDAPLGARVRRGLARTCGETCTVGTRLVLLTGWGMPPTVTGPLGFATSSPAPSKENVADFFPVQDVGV